MLLPPERNTGSVCRLMPAVWNSGRKLTVLSAPVLYGVPLLFPPEIASWRIVIYGALLILVLVLKPEGLAAIDRACAWAFSW